MEEIYFSLFGLTARKAPATLIRGSGEKSAVLAVETLLARNVEHTGGMLVAPPKCRLTLIGEHVFVC